MTEDLYDEAHRLRHANINLEFDLDKAKKRIKALEEGLEEGISALETGKYELGGALSQIVGLKSTIREVYAYAAKAEHGCLRWEDPLPVPDWVDAVRRILAGEITVPVPPDSQRPTASDEAAAQVLNMDPMAVSFIVDVWARESGKAKRREHEERQKDPQQCRITYQATEHMRAACMRNRGHLGNHDHQGER